MRQTILGGVCETQLRRLNDRADGLPRDAVLRADLLVGHAARAQAHEVIAPRGFPDRGQVLERHLV